MNPSLWEVPFAFAESVARTLDDMSATAAQANPTLAGGSPQPGPLAITARHVRAVINDAAPDAYVARLEQAGLLNGGLRFELANEIARKKTWSLRHPALAALLTASSSSVYAPGAWGRRYLATVAMAFGEYRDPDGVLMDLATLALRDRVEDSDAEVAEAQSSVARAQTLSADLQVAEAHLSERDEQLQALVGENAALRSDLDRQAGELMYKDELLDFYKSLTGEDAAEQLAAAQDATERPKARRQKVPGETGIYRTDTGEIEIGFQDDTKTQRWKVLGDVSIDEARAERAQRVGKPVEVAA